MDHVWRMVVEQLRSPAVIVMLTETHEANMEKCHPYFPRTVDEPPMEINDHDEFGDGFRASVRCEAVEETAAGDAIELRKLVIRVHSRQKPPPPTADANGNGAAVGAGHPDGLDVVDEDVVMKSPGKRRAHNSNGEREEDDGGDDERIVYHFLFKKWPDFGVPAIDDLEAFFTLMRMSRDRNADADNPRIVHCSAGVGRSGTFIALEHLQRELDAGVLGALRRPAAEPGRAALPPRATTTTTTTKRPAWPRSRARTSSSPRSTSCASSAATWCRPIPSTCSSTRCCASCGRTGTGSSRTSPPPRGWRWTRSSRRTTRPRPRRRPPPPAEP